MNVKCFYLLRDIDLTDDLECRRTRNRTQVTRLPMKASTLREKQYLTKLLLLGFEPTTPHS
jgi:hypothetical protein